MSVRFIADKATLPRIPLTRLPAHRHTSTWTRWPSQGDSTHFLFLPPPPSSSLLFLPPPAQFKLGCWCEWIGLVPIFRPDCIGRNRWEKGKEKERPRRGWEWPMNTGWHLWAAADSKILFNYSTDLANETNMHHFSLSFFKNIFYWFIYYTLHPLA